MSKITRPMRLIDAAACHRADPARFAVPAATAIAALRTGRSVKIGVEFDTQPAQPAIDAGLHVGAGAKATGERFWCRITTVHTDGIFVAFVDNDLVYTHIHGLKADDLVFFEARHILEIGT